MIIIIASMIIASAIYGAHKQTVPALVFLICAAWLSFANRPHAPPCQPNPHTHFAALSDKHDHR
jgi:hypothetical protein